MPRRLHRQVGRMLFLFFLFYIYIYISLYTKRANEYTYSTFGLFIIQFDSYSAFGSLRCLVHFCFSWSQNGLFG